MRSNSFWEKGGSFKAVTLISGADRKHIVLTCREHDLAQLFLLLPCMKMCLEVIDVFVLNNLSSITWRKLSLEDTDVGFIPLSIYRS